MKQSYPSLFRYTFLLCTLIVSFATTAQKRLFIETNGAVYSFLKEGNTLYMGGQFSQAGYRTGRGAWLSPSNDFPQDGFPDANSTITCIIPDGAGGWYIGGHFTTLGQVAVNRLAHILPDKTVDPAFRPEPNGQVTCLILSGASLYVGGTFTNIGGSTLNRLAKVDAATGVADSWNPNANSTVHAMHIEGGSMYVTGTFTTLGDKDVAYFGKVSMATGEVEPSVTFNYYGNTIKKDGNNLYVGGAMTSGGYRTGRGAWYPTGQRDIPEFTFPKANNQISCIIPDGAGGWYVGGYFTVIGGVNRNRIAHIKADLSVDPDFDANADNEVRCMFLSGNTLYVGGSFTRIMGSTRNRIAAIDLGGMSLLDWDPNANSTVNTIWVLANEVLVGGSFTKIGANSKQQAYYARIDKTSGESLNSIAMNYVVNTIAVEGTNTYLGGQFNQSGFNTAYMASYPSNSDMPTYDFPKANSSINCVIPDGAGGWYVGGNFTQIAEQTVNRLAHIKADMTLDVDFRPDPDGAINALLMDGTRLYVGGSFNNIGGNAQGKIAVIDLTTNQTIPTWNPNANSTVNALAVDGTNLYFGGSFTSVGSSTRGYLASVTKSTGALTAWNPNANSQIRVMQLVNNTLYIGGDFNIIGGNNRKYLAAIDKTSGALNTTWNPDPNHYVLTMQIVPGRAFVGGYFTTIGGQQRNRLASLNLSNGNASFWNPNIGSNVNSIRLDGGSIYVGGNFTQVGTSTARNHAAKFDTGSNTATAWNPVFNTTVNGIAVAGGKVVVVGDFTYSKFVTRSYAQAIDQTTGLTAAFDINPNSYVNTFLINNGTLYLGGHFTTVKTTTRNRVAAINLANGNVLPLNPNVTDAGGNGGVVESLFLRDTLLYIVGSIGKIGNKVRNYAGAWNLAAGTASTWNPQLNSPALAVGANAAGVLLGGTFEYTKYETRGHGATINLDQSSPTKNLIGTWDARSNSYINNLLVDGGLMYAVGSFTQIGGQNRPYVAALSLTNGNATTWNPNAGTTVNDIAISNGIAYLVGNFTTMNGLDRRYLAAVPTNSNSPTAWNPNPNTSLERVVISGNTIFVGGNISWMKYAERQNLMSVDLATGLATTWNPNVNGYVYQLGSDATSIFLAGNFSQVAGQPRSHLAQVLKSNASATTWNPAVGGGIINAMEIVGNTVYIGGSFTTIGVQPSQVTRNRIASIDKTSGAAFPWNPDANGEVNSLVWNNNTVYAGGSFTSIGGQTRNRLAALNTGTDWTATNWDPNSNSTVNKLAISGGKLYAGGHFTTLYANTVNRNRIAEFDVASGNLNAWAPDVNGGIQTITANGGFVYIGGSFSTVAGQAVGNMAVVGPSGNCINYYPSFNSTVQSIMVEDSTIYVGGNFTVYNGTNNSYFTIVRLRPADFVIRVKPSLNPSLGISLYPNPTRGTLHLSASAYKGSDLLWKMYDLQGAQVATGMVSAQSTRLDETLNLPSLKPGTYLMRLASGNRVQEHKVVIE